eukprot:jgi/Chlat1/1209/Chrsp115S01672
MVAMASVAAGVALKGGLAGAPVVCKSACGRGNCGAGAAGPHGHAVRPAVIAGRPPKPQWQQGLAAGLAAAAASAAAFPSAALADVLEALDAVEVPSLPKVELPAISLPQVELPSVPQISMPVVSDDMLAGGVDPIVLAAGAGVVVLPLIGVALLLTNKGYAGDVTPAGAIDMLDSTASAVLIDIRPRADIRETGSPDLRSVGKKLYNVEWESVDRAGNAVPNGNFVDDVKALSAVDEKSIVILLDSFGTASVKAAKELGKSRIKAYAIKEGVDGPRGWLASDLPWKKPVKLSFPDLSNLPSFEIDSKLAATSAAVVAVAGASALFFAEMETILEVLGVTAVVQLLVKRLLFADDRKKTYDEIISWVDNKFGPGEGAEQFKSLVNTVFNEKGQPAAPAAASDAIETAVEAVNDAAESVSNATEALASAAEAPAEAPASAPASTSAAQEHAAASSSASSPSKDELPPSPAPSSPYTVYPDLKPPTSPAPPSSPVVSQ